MPIPLPTPPATDPAWTLANPGARTEPDNSTKANGFGSNTRPPFQFFNWIIYNLTLWVEWALASINLLNNAAVPYEASIGTGGTYADINAAMADGALAAGSRLIILNSLALTTTQQITKNNISIDLKPGVVLSDSGANTGIRISATRVRIRGGKMSGFPTQAILIDAGSDFALIGELMLASNTVDITDNNGKGATYALINET